MAWVERLLLCVPEAAEIPAGCQAGGEDGEQRQRDEARDQVEAHSDPLVYSVRI